MLAVCIHRIGGELFLTEKTFRRQDARLGKSRQSLQVEQRRSVDVEHWIYVHRRESRRGQERFGKDAINLSGVYQRGRKSRDF